ncbi:MAG: hypothetical protein V4504_01665 [Patescibacteria group bacterium]
METTLNSMYTGNPKYDLHLSAYDISLSSIKKLEELGFVRDHFANNRYCDTTAYHGSFPGWQPNETIYSKIKEILSEDKVFNGGLEEEITVPSNRIEIIPVADIRDEASSEIMSQFISIALPEKKNVTCPDGRYKACDIHLNVHWKYSYDRSKEVIDSFGLVSFDKPDVSKLSTENNFSRIYTMTFESLSEGLVVFNAMKKVISPERGFGIQGKLKLEITTRIFRKPHTGIMLPIILKD